MKVYKFGGASLNGKERIENVAKILSDNKNKQLVVIFSAMGKTTNAMEKVVDEFYAGNGTKALQLFDEIKQNHLQIASKLVSKNLPSLQEQLLSFFTEVEWLLHDQPVQSYDYYYDQIVCIGELLSSCIVSSFLNENEVANTWLDVRDLLRTDNNFREANIDWKTTTENIEKAGIGNQQKIFVTQGFIGCTDQNESTTLGREGSDYTAAIFANLLNAESLTIWKDVEGVMSADPKMFSSATLMSELSFNEVIEMAFYGAQVIHPKTIKPLQNKQTHSFTSKVFSKPSITGYYY